MSIVKASFKGFTQQQKNTASTCRRFQNSTGLTTARIISVVDKNMINNSPITGEEIKHTLSIWGPSVPNINRKITRRGVDAVILSEEIYRSYTPTYPI